MVYTLFDALPTFLDSNGKPIVGRLTFFEANGTTYKPIYADQEYTTLLSNPLLTDMGGKPSHQVFLKNGIYRVVVEKFIGDGIADMNAYMYEGYEANSIGTTSHWQFEKEFVIDSGNLESSSISTYELLTVRYISDLRQVDFATHPVVQVLDYDENVKNIAPRTYIWVDGNGRPEDFGVTIISNRSNTGRWVLCESSIMESTTFGISTYTDPGVLASRLNGLATYSQDNYGKANVIYFQPGTYTLLNGSQVRFAKPIVCNGNLKFVLADADNESAKVTFDKGLSYTGTSELNGKNVELKIREATVKTSWYRYDANSSSYDGSDGWYNTVIMNVDDGHTRAFEKCHVIIDTDINNAALSFEDCLVTLNADIKKANTEFVNCTFDCAEGVIAAAVTINGVVDIYPQMFASDLSYEDITIDEDVRYYLEDWGADAYVSFKQQQGDTNIGSLNGKTLTSEPELADDTHISNFSGKVKCKGVEVFISNWDGYIETNGTSILHIDNSTVSVRNNSVGSMYLDGVNLSVKDNGLLTVSDSFTAENCMIDAKLKFNTSGATFVNCNITKDIDSSTVTAIGFSRCSINADVDCKDITAEYCTINGVITETASNSLDFNISHCTFGTTGLHHIEGSSGSSVKCNGTWAHNLSLRTDKHFIEVDRTHLDSDESEHSYVYEDNNGPKVLQRYSANWKDTLTFYDDYQDIYTPWHDQDIAQVRKIGMYADDGIKKWKGISGTEAGRGETTDKGSYFTECEIFSVAPLTGQWLLLAIPSTVLTGPAEPSFRIPSSPWKSEFTDSNRVVVHTDESVNTSEDSGMPATMWHVSDFKYRLAGETGIRGKMLTAQYLEAHQEIEVRFFLKNLDLDSWNAEFYL